ncbi:hypothetical protein A3736_03755 [Erythrobacter sp. HI0063]|nr:hypothetical protein A3736_03755 [Erythrobacter sp. HI0063]
MGQAHYFIKGDVEPKNARARGAFYLIAQDTAGTRSLAKSEIVVIYSKRDPDIADHETPLRQLYRALLPRPRKCIRQREDGLRR